MNAVSRDRAITALVAVMLACGLTGQAIARGERAGGGGGARGGGGDRRLFSRRRCVGWRILVRAAVRQRKAVHVRVQLQAQIKAHARVPGVRRKRTPVRIRPTASRARLRTRPSARRPRPRIRPSVRPRQLRTRVTVNPAQRKCRTRVLRQFPTCRTTTRLSQLFQLGLGRRVCGGRIRGGRGCDGCSSCGNSPASGARRSARTGRTAVQRSSGRGWRGRLLSVRVDMVCGRLREQRRSVHAGSCAARILGLRCKQKIGRKPSVGLHGFHCIRQCSTTCTAESLLKTLDSVVACITRSTWS